MRPPGDVWVNRHRENKFIVLAVEVVEVVLIGDSNVSQPCLCE